MICAVLLVISSVLVLLLFNIEAKAFSSTTYKQAFADQRLYERMPQILASAISAFLAENPNSLPFLKALKVEDWQNIISTILPPEELKGVADNTLDSTFDYLNGKTNSANLSLLPFKSRLVGESGINVVVQILGLQPACTPEQITQIVFGLLGGEIALCNPPPEAMGLLAPFIQGQLQAIINIFPNEVTFISGAASGTPNDPRLELNTVRFAIKLSLFLPALFLFGIVIFAVHTFRDLLIWWGWPLMIAGGISVLLALFGSPLIGWILQLVIQRQGAIFIPPVLAASLGETASAVARQMLQPVMIEGFIVGFVGLGMVVIATFLLRDVHSDPITSI